MNTVGPGARKRRLGMDDMSEHRVPMLGASWRRFEDPVRSRDPRIRALVSALATLPAPSPTPEFRAELRAQLVAIAPRIVAESADANTDLIDIVADDAVQHPVRAAARRPRHTDSVLARLRAVPIGRPVRVAVAVIATFAVLLGGAVWMSKKALPGDALYGLKRASENVQLNFAGSDTEKAKDLLGFAVTRAGEVKGLLSRAGVSGDGAQASGLDSHTAGLIQSTLASADSDVKSASSLLTTQAVQKKSAAPLTVLTRWAPKQLSRLQTIAAVLPSPALRNRTESSADLVSAAVTHAQQLAPKVAGGCSSSATSDPLGPLPIGACGTGGTSIVPPVLGGQSSTSNSPSNPAGSGAAGNGQNASVVPGETSTTNGVQPTAGEPTKSGGSPLPPIKTPSLPVSVSSCGINASLGPIGIGIGLCSGIHLSLHP
jgi:hypothetical protein